MATTASFRIAAAQSQSLPKNLSANIVLHSAFVRAAADVDIIIFPELSLVGYELDGGAHAGISPHDPRLLPLQRLASATGTIIVAGALLASDRAAPMIGSILFSPSGARSVYTKHYLHPGEERYVVPGAGGAAFAVGTHTVALAICADTTHAEHACAAAQAQASIYACSVLISAAGYAADAAQLQGYAARYPYAVVMANHGGPTGGWAAAGRSAIWAPGGALVVAAPGAGNALVIATHHDNQWHGEVRAVDHV